MFPKPDGNKGQLRIWHYPRYREMLVMIDTGKNKLLVRNINTGSGEANERHV